MSSDLDELIDFYQWEMRRLLISIEENKRDQDFIAVDYNYQELRYIQHELNRLLELKDPNYPKIKRLEKEVEFYSKSDEPFVDFSELNAPMLKKAEEELKKLKLHKPIPPAEETQILDEALFSLAQNEIKGFTIHLDMNEGFKIELNKKGENLIHLSIRAKDENDVGQLRRNDLLSDLGLNYVHDLHALVKVFEIGRNKNVLPIKEAISRIVIGTKGFLWEEGTIYLKLKT